MLRNVQRVCHVVGPGIGEQGIGFIEVVSVQADMAVFRDFDLLPGRADGTLNQDSFLVATMSPALIFAFGMASTRSFSSSVGDIESP